MDDRLQLLIYSIGVLNAKHKNKKAHSTVLFLGTSKIYIKLRTIIESRLSENWADTA